MNVWISTILSIIAISTVSLIGIFTFIVNENKFKKILLLFVSLSTGTLFGSAFVHLLPEAAEQMGGFTLELGLYTLAGIIVFYVLENFIHWRHCHIPTSKHHPHPVGLMNLVGDGLHNIIDGMVIAAAYIASPQIGIATTLAVLVHEIPQEIGDFGVLVHAGYSKGKALLFNLLSALAALIGAVFILALGTAGHFSIIILPFTAGGFIYIAGSDLIPELKKECFPFSKVFYQFAWMIMGIALMVALLYLGVE